MSAGLARAGRARRDGRALSARRRSGGLDLRRPVRRAAGGGGRRAPGHRLGRGERRGGDRDRPHRPRLRPGGLRAGQGQRPGGHRPHRRVRTSSARGSAGSPAATRAPTTPAGADLAREVGRRPRAQGAAGGARAVPAQLPGLLALRDAGRLPARGRVVHRHGPAAGAAVGRHAHRHLAAGGDRARGARARLAAQHVATG